MSNCSICDTPITEVNDSREHVIPNSIGGRRTVTGFLCTKCNSQAGDDWDAELARQFNPLCLVFGIVRERGDVPSQRFDTTRGDRVELHADGTMSPHKPEYAAVPAGKGIQIHIKARSMSEAKKMLASVRRKYPEVNLEEVLKRAQPSSSYRPDMLKFELSFGGPRAGRSLVKSVLALAVQSGIEGRMCECARNYLKDSRGEACFGYYYERDLVVNRPTDRVVHCVAVKGDPASRQLLGYVEYFGVLRAVVGLSDSYGGREFTSSYAVDPVTGEELNTNVNLTLSRKELRAAYDYQRIPPGAIERAFHQVLPIALGASLEKERSRVLTRALQDAIKQCGLKEGEIITPEHAKKISKVVANSLEPFLLHLLDRTEK